MKVGVFSALGTKVQGRAVWGFIGFSGLIGFIGLLGFFGFVGVYRGL